VLESDVERFASGAPHTQEHILGSNVEGSSINHHQEAKSVLERRYTMHCESLPAFTHTWPDAEPNTYEDPLSVTVENDGRKAYFVVGKAKSPKKQLGQLRWRYNIFLTSTKGNTQGLNSVLDFVAGNEFDQDSLMVSLIRQRDGKLVRENETVPPEYRGFHLAPFNQIVRGPYARGGLAVVADKDDLETMIRHSVIRAVQKGWLRW
jgi:hypothetical protein